MSKNEFLEAYVAGSIGRRQFINGLVGLGVSLPAAGAYAVSLRPMEVAAADEFYGLTSKEQCKNGGYAAFGFKNQGQCIRYVNTGKTGNQAKGNGGRKSSKAKSKS